MRCMCLPWPRRTVLISLDRAILVVWSASRMKSIWPSRTGYELITRRVNFSSVFDVCHGLRSVSNSLLRTIFKRGKTTSTPFYFEASCNSGLSHIRSVSRIYLSRMGVNINFISHIAVHVQYIRVAMLHNSPYISLVVQNMIPFQNLNMIIISKFYILKDSCPSGLICEHAL